MRALDPTRDLGPIADLIAKAFAEDLDERAQAALRELRWMARLSPLVWWWSQTDPAFQDAFNGFVWEDASPDGKGRQIVGNVSLNRAPGSRQRFIICNVVVQEAYRGQGIARRLTEAAIAEAELMGAEGVVLQVHEDNQPAVHLYSTLGFREVVGEIDLHLDTIPSVALLDAPGYNLRAWQPSDGRATLRLAKGSIPLILQWLRPVKAADYRPDWLSRLGHGVGDLLAGRRTLRLLALHDGDVVGLLKVTMALRSGKHQLDMLVHPDHAGCIEPALISRALHMLASAPPKPIGVTVVKEPDAALNVLRDYGFQLCRTLLTQRRDFA
jgi:ribosomal protein S18 acetylase RimI-like enzyme